MVIETKEKNVSKQSVFAGWIRLFFISIMTSICLLWAVFGIWSYLNPPQISSPIATNSRTDKLILSGRDGAYFLTIPMQQIQLTESISPLRTLEVQIAFALKFASDKEQIESKLPFIQDILISYLRTMTLNELQETGRLFYIKEAILERMNNLLFPVQIQDVLFQKIVVKEGL